LIATCRDVAAMIQANPDVTDAMRIDLGLPVRKTPAPIPVPAQAPNLDVVSVTGRTITLKLHDGTDLRAKPAGVAEAWIFSYVGDTAPEAQEAWHFEGAASRTNTQIAPAAATGGVRLWLRACWVNAKAQRGPYCSPVSTAVQLASDPSAAQASPMDEVAGQIRKAA
jgi:hypothetical protein